MTNIIFIILGFFAVAGALAVLLQKNLIYAALGLFLNVLAIAGLFALLEASFVAMAQLFILGTVVMFLLFAILYLNINNDHFLKEPKKNFFIGLGAIIMLPINALVLDTIGKIPQKDTIDAKEGFGGIEEFGMILYKDWAIVFELVAILALIALIGSVILAKKRTEGNKNE